MMAKEAKAGMDEDAQSLVQMFRSIMRSEDGCVMEAAVISTEPLRVQAVNDEKLVLSAVSLVVPRRLTDYTVEATVGWSTEQAAGGSGDAAFAPHSHAVAGRKAVLVHNALAVGDVVYLLPYHNGKKYYVLDRKG